MVWSQIKIRFEVIPDDSMVSSRLISGTIVQTVKVWMQRMMKIGRSVDFATRNAKYLDVFAGNEECTEKPDEPFQWERMQCVFEGSSLKFAGVDGDIINAHDKNHTAGCDKGKNEFLKFCFWHSKPSL